MEEQKNKKDRIQKTNRKMAGVNSTLSITTLNVNGLNPQKAKVGRRDGKKGEPTKRYQ